MSIMTTNGNGKRFYSKLNRIKNKLQNVMVQERLNTCLLCAQKTIFFKKLTLKEVFSEK